MSFSEQLKKARLDAGLTQQQVAEAIGITNSTYCGYETGKRQPDVEKIRQIAKLLHTSGDQLLETGFAEKEKAPAQEEQELTEVDLQIINLLPFVPEKVKAGVVQILAATVDLAAAQGSSGQYIQEARALAAQADSDDMQQQQRG